MDAINHSMFAEKMTGSGRTDSWTRSHIFVAPRLKTNTTKLYIAWRTKIRRRAGYVSNLNDGRLEEQSLPLGEPQVEM